MSSQRSPVLFAVFVYSFCAVFGVASGAFALASAGAAFDTAEVIAGARSLPVGGTLRVAMVPLNIGGKSARATLRLERFDVFTADARIVLHTGAGERLLPIPANVYLRGQIEGDAQSRVVLSVLESGEVRGLVTSTGRTWLMGSTTPGDLLQAREVEAGFELEEPGGGFRCALDDLGPQAFRADGPGGSRTASENLSEPLPEALTALLDAAPAPGSRIPEGVLFDHTAVIAIETDQEFLALDPIDGNTTTAANYIGDLVAFASTIYTAELQTSWAVGHISLWATPDPWQQTSPSCGLIDFGRYWNNNNAGIARTVTHFLSGKSTNAGIAWIGVLCSGAFSLDAAQVATGCSPALTGVSNWGGGYGYTSGIDANFSIDSPSVVWDIQALTHEIGHNFNSGHTHCYQNIGGNAAAVDNCYAGQCGTTGCYCGGTSLPGAAGTGSGTIMSYCHLLGGGNVSLTLGRAHPFGVAPERVPDRMRSHVVSVAGPSCLAPVGVLFVNGFQSGNTSAWSVTAP